MKTIKVQLSEVEYNAFGFSKDLFAFSEFTDIIERQIASQSMHKCVTLSQLNGLSSMTMDEINAEIKEPDDEFTSDDLKEIEIARNSGVCKDITKLEKLLMSKL